MVPLQLPPPATVPWWCEAQGLLSDLVAWKGGQGGKDFSRATSVMDSPRLSHAVHPGEPRFGSSQELLQPSLPSLSFQWDEEGSARLT